MRNDDIKKIQKCNKPINYLSTWIVIQKTAVNNNNNKNKKNNSANALLSKDFDKNNS